MNPVSNIYGQSLVCLNSDLLNGPSVPVKQHVHREFWDSWEEGVMVAPVITTRVAGIPRIQSFFPAMAVLSVSTG